MSYQHIPTLRFELESIKMAVQSSLCTHTEELNQYIVDCIEKTLTEDWILKEIQIEVNNVIENAIKEISGNYRIQAAITEIISDKVRESILRKNGDEQ